MANFATSSAGVVDTSGKFATGVNVTSGIFATVVNDTGGKFDTRVNDTGVNDTMWQTMETISDCWQLKVNLNENIYLYANSTT